MGLDIHIDDISHGGFAISRVGTTTHFHTLDAIVAAA